MVEEKPEGVKERNKQIDIELSSSFDTNEDLVEEVSSKNSEKMNDEVEEIPERSIKKSVSKKKGDETKELKGNKEIQEARGVKARKKRLLSNYSQETPLETEATERINTNNSTKINSNNDNNRKFRKKRKTFSCDTCRKFKTRCDFEPLVGKCHRCNMLQINCSLTNEREDEILEAIENSSKNSTLATNSLAELPNAVTNTDLSKINMISKGGINPVTQTLNNRLNRVEEKFNSLDSKLELVLLLLQGSSNAESTVKQLIPAKIKHDGQTSPSLRTSSITQNDLTNTTSTNYQHFLPPTTVDINSGGETFNGIHLKEPPLKLINAIDERLFPSEAISDKEKLEQQQRPFVVARVNFLQFYQKNSQLCHKLVRNFLVRSHFWIIPGGIKEIDEKYAHKHLFITSVFTIIAMSFDDNEKYSEKQETLYPLVERLLTNTLTMFEELTDFDIEAILYCCMFHISRKSKRHRQLKFNSLVLSNFAISSMLNVVDFHQIKDRVLVQEKFDAKDLYHLRILNSLTACKLEYSISYGNVLPLDRMLMEFNNLTAKFPQANFGDDIKISEINLGDTVNSIYLNFKTYYKSIKEKFEEEHFDDNESGPTLHNNLHFTFPELEYWLKNWEELLSKDGGGVLLFTYDFYHIMICRSFISEFLNEMKESSEFLLCILTTMREHAYSLLNGFLRLPPSLIRGAPIFTMHQLVYACLTLCDFLHWFEQFERQHVLNICSRIYWHLNTIGERMNDATDNVGKIIKSIIDTSKTRVSLTKLPYPIDGLLENKKNKNKNSMNANETTSLEPESQLQEHTSENKNRSEKQSIPDVDQFNSFEDFFQDFFDNLKPATQRIFSSEKNLK